MRRIEVQTDGSLPATMGCMIAFVFMAAAWATHVIWIIQTLASDKGATVGQMVRGALGAVIPPVGIIHGVMIWAGAS